jgi:hypothetical protein
MTSSLNTSIQQKLFWNSIKVCFSSFKVSKRMWEICEGTILSPIPNNDSIPDLNLLKERCICKVATQQTNYNLLQ